MDRKLDPPPTFFPAVQTLDRSGHHALAEALREKVNGEIRFDDGSRALYATDASNYRQTPIGVVVPRNKQAVIDAVAVCRDFGVPITSRGGGTSLAGQCCNFAVILDLSKYYHAVLEIDAENRLGRVQPGCVLDDFRAEAGKRGLTFGPDPATHSHCTLGGMLGNDSCGTHSIMATFAGQGARVADNTQSLEVLTYDGLQLTVGPTSEAELERIIAAGGRKGEIYRRLKNLRDRHADAIRSQFPKIPRRVSGYNLPQLLPENGCNVARALVGSEGTCVTILEATLALIPEPRARALVVLGYPDAYVAADACPALMPFKPIGLEGFDDVLVEDMRKKGLHAGDIQLLPKGKGWLLVEFAGETPEEAKAKAQETMDSLRGGSNPPGMRLFCDQAQAEKIWAIRESGLGAAALIPGLPQTWPGWEDSAVPPERLGAYLRELRKLFDRYGYHAALYGHFGQGCVHCRIDFDLQTIPGLKRYRAFLNEAADLVVSFGGSLSGEHGDGQCRAELLPRMFSAEIIDAFRAFKAIWDPANKMNPGKVVDPYPILSNLRLGADYHPWEPRTHFQFPADEGSFAKASLRCVGVGKCRRNEGGTMCPSYMVTREEKHSTRGRARLLFEMLRGETIGRRGWRDERVKEALDLCLACKGCKGDCPVNVDLATYKSEFLSHYYRGRLRPTPAYAMGLIHWWARLASQAPQLANFLTQTPPFGPALKRLGGIAPARTIPRFADETFKAWFRRTHRAGYREGGRVILWPDTFNNHFHPETAQAAVRFLEANGFRVIIPEAPLCCGRPLYDWGMLPLAKRLLREVLQALRAEIRAGTPVIGLEPSCVAVFRDELLNLFPHDEDAKRLAKQTYHLSEFLNREAPHIRLPRLQRKALLHGHCQHKAVMKLADEVELLHKLGLELELPDSGCCGMAGAFGFERDKYEVSVRCGERVLLPAVRNAPKDALIIADGFSCREQIEQLTDRHALHLAQVLQMASEQGARGGSGEDYPERRFSEVRAGGGPRLLWGTLGLAALFVGAAIYGRMGVAGRRLGRRWFH